MTKENILLQVKKALENNLNDEHYSATLTLMQLAESLLDDVRTEANKKSGAGKVEKILKDIFNNAAKEGNMKMMQYTTIRENGKQYALDGHRLLEINTPLAAPVWERDAQEGSKQAYYQVEKMMVSTPSLEVQAPDLMELKAMNKYYKKSKKTCVILEASNGVKICVNARYLENALTNFTNPKIYASEDGTKRNPIYITGDEGRLLILPINFDDQAFTTPGCYNLYTKKRFTLETEKEAAQVA